MFFFYFEKAISRQLIKITGCKSAGHEGFHYHKVKNILDIPQSFFCTRTKIQSGLNAVYRGLKSKRRNIRSRGLMKLQKGHSPEVQHAQDRGRNR